MNDIYAWLNPLQKSKAQLSDELRFVYGKIHCFVPWISSYILTGIVCTHVLLVGREFIGACEWLKVTHSMNYYGAKKKKKEKVIKFDFFKQKINKQNLIILGNFSYFATEKK